MIRICAWCGRKMGEKEPLSDCSMTHGMCEACLEKMKERASESPIKAEAGSGGE